VSGLDHDTYSHDDFAGNGYVSLMSVPLGTPDASIENGLFSLYHIQLNTLSYRRSCCNDHRTTD
jgi:hypothetical protein